MLRSSQPPSPASEHTGAGRRRSANPNAIVGGALLRCEGGRRVPRRRPAGRPPPPGGVVAKSLRRTGTAPPRPVPNAARQGDAASSPSGKPRGSCGEVRTTRHTVRPRRRHRALLDVDAARVAPREYLACQHTFSSLPRQLPRRPRRRAPETASRVARVRSGSSPARLVPRVTRPRLFRREVLVPSPGSDDPPRAPGAPPLARILRRERVGASRPALAWRGRSRLGARSPER